MQEKTKAFENKKASTRENSVGSLDNNNKLNRSPKTSYCILPMNLVNTIHLYLKLDNANKL